MLDCQMPITFMLRKTKYKGECLFWGQHDLYCYLTIERNYLRSKKCLYNTSLFVTKLWNLYIAGFVHLNQDPIRVQKHYVLFKFLF